MSQPPTIDAMQAGDWSRVRAIYREGLATGVAAFMTTPPVWPKWNAGHLQIGRLVMRRGQDILGWSALAPVADS